MSTAPLPTEATEPQPAPDLPMTWTERLLILGLRLSAIGMVAWFLLQLPLPILEAWLPLRDVAVVLGALIFGGKALFDTLFYDHFWP